jgi:hypothetical protein
MRDIWLALLGRVAIRCSTNGDVGGGKVMALVIFGFAICFSLGAITGLLVAGLAASASDKDARSVRGK